MKFLVTILFALGTLQSNSQRTPSEDETVQGIKVFRKSTIAIGVVQNQIVRNSLGKQENKKLFNPIGTGFCAYVLIDSTPYYCFITAKHVIFKPNSSQTLDSISIRFNSFDSLALDEHFGTTIGLNYPDGTPTWYCLPDSTIDVVCIPVTGDYDWPIKEFPFLPYWTFANEIDYFEGKEIFTLGYPSILTYDLLNKALLRRGIINYVPSFKNNNQNVLIDCNVFPGNSGGPVFAVSHNSGQILFDTVPQLVRLYGIVLTMQYFTNPIISNNGAYLVDNTGQKIFSQTSSSVGGILPVNRIREVLDIFKRDVELWLTVNRHKKP